MEKDKTANNQHIIDTAMELARRGFSVVPVNENKAPAGLWVERQQVPFTPDEIRNEIIRTGAPMIGIVTGRVSGLTVVDADAEQRAEWVTKLLPKDFETVMVRSPRKGGQHFWFQYDPDLPTFHNAEMRMDIQSDGAMIIVPPSARPDGEYQYLGGRSIFETDPAPVPQELKNAVFRDIYSNNPFYAQGDRKDPENTVLTKPYESLQFLTKGSRDDDLFHVANCLVKGNLEPEKVSKVLEILALNCKPPFPLKEAQAKANSALKRSGGRERNLADELRKWIFLTNAYFSLTDAYNTLQILTCQKNAVHQIMHRFAKEGFIERHPQKNGYYRRVDTDISLMDFADADPDDTVNLILPLDIHKKTIVYPKSAIVLSGVSGMGKTLFTLATIEANLRTMDCYYFNSEMSPQQLKKKLSFFDTPMKDFAKHMKVVDDWDFNNIADKIQPDALNCIDYLEPDADKPFLIHAVISQIIRRLRRGVALIAVQKKPGNDDGTGGIYSRKAASLALALEFGKIWITKNRNREADPSPSRNSMFFDVVGGHQFVKRGDWQEEQKKAM